VFIGLIDKASDCGSKFLKIIENIQIYFSPGKKAFITRKMLRVFTRDVQQVLAGMLQIRSCPARSNIGRSGRN
jgi:hypothetical protein